MNRCYTTPSLFQREQKGILFDKEKKDCKYVYMVYLEEVRILTRFKSYEEYENLSQHSFQLFFFTNEHSLKKKIRIQIIKPNINTNTHTDTLPATHTDTHINTHINTHSDTNSDTNTKI